jgi:hypothetical protein
MNITRETIKETLKAIMAEESDYQTFFKKALEKAGKSIPSMSDEEKKKFFNKIDAAWNAKGEKNEGNAFGAAVVAAKEKGEDEFEVGGKTYKVESVNERLSNSEMKRMDGLHSYKKMEDALKTLTFIGKELYEEGFEKPEIMEFILHKVNRRLHLQIRESVTEGRAFVQAARKAKEEGKTEFEFNGKTYPVTLKEEAINERRLGKVSLLRSVEDGETSRVEGVKLSKDLAFELRMFLQRPLLARTRTGIAIDNAQMKDAIPMLAKVGVHKRLSSGVKKEFADLLKKYKWRVGIY